MVRESLDFHEMLSNEIESETNEPTFRRVGRIYWSFDKTDIEHKRKIWAALGIDTVPLDLSVLERVSLLRKDREIEALNVIGDGKFFPQTPMRIIQFLKNRFPDRFFVREGTVAEIHRDPESGLFHQVKEVATSGKISIIPVKSILGSPGHSDVQIFVRVTQGANFNALVADKNDLYNIAENLSHFFCGIWKPISIGTCTRKTGLTNIPEYQTGFWYNHSGIGYSASAASFELFSSPI